MPPGRDESLAVSRPALWTGLWGGALAWLVQFIAIWIISEFGCLLAPEREVLPGLTLVAFLVVIVSALCLGVAFFSTMLAWNARAVLRGAEGERRGTERFIANAGLLASGLFVVVIIIQAVPVFFYLEQC